MIQEVQTRFVYTFSFEARLEDLKESLLREKVSLGNEPVSLWQSPALHPMHLDELLEHARGFLSGSGEDGCSYFQLSKEVGNAWLSRLSLKIEKLPKSLSVNLGSDPGIELFLSGRGLGLLSLAFKLADKGITREEALLFNYAIGQFKRREVGELRKPHPKEDPARWERIPESARMTIPDPPKPDTPLTDRLGAAGGVFSLRELVEECLLPDKAFNLKDTQDELSVYTIVRLDSDVDFSSATCRNELAPLLSGLAQLEEPEHAGATLEILNVANAVLNRKHWVAVGQLGVAHLIADQPPPEGRKDHPYNEQRLPVIRDKYFIPYLLASFQKLALNRAAERARKAASLPEDHLDEGLSECREDLLKFGMNGLFAQVSTRDVLHRFYRLVQKGFDIPSIWQSVRETISDADAKLMAKSMDRNLHAIADVQKLTHLVEYILVPVYIAHLVHMTWSEGQMHWPILGFAVLAALVFFWIDRLRRHLGQPILPWLDRKTRGARKTLADGMEQRLPMSRSSERSEPRTAKRGKRVGRSDSVL